MDKNFSKSLQQCLHTIFSPVLSKLLNEASKPTPEIEQLTSIVRSDPTLTVSILSLVNSSFYGFSQKILDLQRAIVALGSREILKIALSVTMQDAAKNSGSFELWRENIWAALGAETLLKHFEPSLAQTAYICALVKDISVMLLPCLKQAEDEGEVARVQGEHGQLSCELLHNWDIPDDILQVVAAHHDLHNIKDYDLLTQMVILATNWAEVEFEQNRPEPLFQFQTVLNKLFDVSKNDFEAMRLECRKKFKAICSSLDISEPNKKKRYYDFSLPKMQQYYFLSQDLLTAQGGIKTIFNIIARHLKWIWDIDEFELALLRPGNSDWTLFSYRQKDIQITESKDLEDISFSISNHEFLLQAGEGKLGFLHLRTFPDYTEFKDDFSCYLRFLSIAYEGYWKSQAQMEFKALTLEMMPLSVALLDIEGRVVQVNQLMLNMLNLKLAPKGRDFWELLEENGLFSKDSEWERFLNSDESFKKLYCPFEIQQGKQGCFLFSAYKININQYDYILTMILDISSLSDLEYEVLKQREFLKNLIYSMQDTVLTVNENGKILFISPSLPVEIKGKNIFDYMIPDKNIISSWNSNIFNTSKDEYEPIEVNFKWEKNLDKPLELLISPLSYTDHFLVVARDLTSVRRLEQQLKIQACYDNLTRIFNRHQFQRIIKNEISKAKHNSYSLGIIFFDVDKFKNYNDKYGHQAGDIVLSKIGLILRENIRKGCDFPCRYGGDEFIVLSSNIDFKSLENLALRIKNKFTDLFEDTMTLSMGGAIFDSKEDVDNFLLRADRASYSSKSKGGNIFTWAEKYIKN